MAETIGSNYTVAERLNRNPANIGICEHTSKNIIVEELDTIDLNKVVGTTQYPTQKDINEQNLYQDGQFLYTNGIMHFTSTLAPNWPTNTPLNFKPGRELFLVQSKKKNFSALDHEWTIDIPE